MARVVHFEIPVDDPARASAFYEAAFGWGITPWGADVDYLLCSTGPEDEPGINGALRLRTPETPGLGLGIAVEALDDACKAVESAGGKVLERDMAIPGVGWLAVVADSEGNILSMIQGDPAVEVPEGG